jgi:hypothetical protein
MCEKALSNGSKRGNRTSVAAQARTRMSVLVRAGDRFHKKFTMPRRLVLNLFQRFLTICNHKNVC